VNRDPVATAPGTDCIIARRRLSQYLDFSLLLIAITIAHTQECGGNSNVS